MPNAEQPPRLDLTKIDFPTDRVTFRQMRLGHPAGFTKEALSRADAQGIDLIATHIYELNLVEAAFRASAGVPRPRSEPSRADWLKVLNDAYRQYGLSSGMQETRQLVRDLEAAAALQAGQHRR